VCVDGGEKQSQWFGRVERMDRTEVPGKALELKFKGKRPIARLRTRWFNKYWKIARREEGAGNKPKRKDCGRKR
jgi:hypothetical protein